MCADPRMYQGKTPNFRILAAKYPDTFGRLSCDSVSDDGGYEAKIDFQIPDAVRCLAETLLKDDFDLHVSFSPINLCPMIPNRLAYIAVIQDLLVWSLPTWHLLRHFTDSQSSSNREATGRVSVRGLDIGTGASAIYPILGLACFPAWEFTATDVDKSSLAYAQEHVVDHPGNESIGRRVKLVQAKPDDPYIPIEEEAVAKETQSVVGEAGRQEEKEFDFVMCNPPFYSSPEEMNLSASFKKRPANAICHGTSSEMVTRGGELSFVRRMVSESITTNSKVLWWTCLLGKLSSVIALAGELKKLSGEAKVFTWGVSELPTGGGKTRRWVILWSVLPLRICDSLSRGILPASLDKLKPPSGERRSKKYELGPAWTRKELFEVVREMLRELDGCHIFPSAYSRFDTVHSQPRGDNCREGELGASTFRMEEVSGALDVVLTAESWTRRARRAKARSEGASSMQHISTEPLLIARISVSEFDVGKHTGLWLKACWTYGKDSVKFESFASFLLGAIDRKVASSTG
ncbi:uncharacterized protein MEPE_04525 [Melanopsichium pennsylvanicum]|uniref:U6 small nuclear RNA (adenine-(43)-N(6))-methyltransferase n=1 Tax=Melanopsichium pennsylvanicum TaxID=63383 RepID=A0AAJ5C6G7_9BASI|nr:uncharacterized protein MEPE_04525 [Melanopsichium pennsylvanicum]